jgi:hypothetical protein
VATLHHVGPVLDRMARMNFFQGAYSAFPEFSDRTLGQPDSKLEENIYVQQHQTMASWNYQH